MENQINVAELLKDCPKGMELDCTMYDNLYFDSLNADYYSTINCYTLIDGVKTSIDFTKYGTFNNHAGAKCVIFPKGKTTWEGFVPPCQFKDGDIVAGENRACSYITIFRKLIDNTSFSHHACLTSFGKFKIDDFADNSNLRIATEAEKQKLFDTIKANGYKWNEKTKTLEKLVKPKFKVGDVIQDIDTYKVKITEVSIEDECYEYESMDIKGIGSIGFSEQDNWEVVSNKFDITTLKPFDKVLIRDFDKNIWCASIFSNTWKNKYYCVGMWHNQCIPYEGNEHLLGTTDDCDEFYKNW